MTAAAARPLRIGTSATAATLARVFERGQFNEPALSEALQLPNLEAADHPVFKTFVDRLTGRGLFEVLARLFVFGEVVDRAAVSAHLTDDELSAFSDVDLIRPWNPGAAREQGERLFSPVRMVPVHVAGICEHMIVAGDRGDHPDGSEFIPFSDIVFPGHNPLTRQFLKLLPLSQGSVLELCAGTAVAALATRLRGNRSTAADIADRSVHFARFNGWLNGCADLEVVCGDLYQPIGARRFDCILAHPPYVPAFVNKLTYRDGGETGDEIIRGVVAGVPEHLNPGGTFLVLCLAMDTAEGPFEERARHWLGPAGSDFDLVFALDSTTPPELIASRLIEKSGGALADVFRLRDLFGRVQVKEFVYGALVGRRGVTGAVAAPVTRRVQLTKETTAEGFEWLFRWFEWLRQPGGRARVLDLRPVLPAGLRLDVLHRIDAGTFTPALYFLENGGKPFRARLKTEPWVPALLSEMNGERTVREVFRDAAQRKRVPPDFTEADLEQMMCYLLERGCIAGVPSLDAAVAMAGTPRQ